jgi:hypothetical protein
MEEDLNFRILFSAYGTMEVLLLYRFCFFVFACC